MYHVIGLNSYKTDECFNDKITKVLKTIPAGRKAVAARNSKMARYSVYQEKVNDVTFVISFIIGTTDSNLIDLANDKDALGFPRGFAFVFILEGEKENLVLINTTCFLDKFSNDDRQQETQLSIFDGVEGISMSKKVSGSLGMFSAFEYNGHHYLTSFAKNSCGNVFSREAFRLLKPSEKFVDEIIKNHWSLCCEVCSDHPDMGHHGYLNEEATIFVIAIGTTVGPKIFNPYSYPDSQAICVKWNLSVEDRIEISKEGVIPIMKRIGENRNFMTDVLFEEIIGEGIANGYVKLHKGTVKHSRLSKILEGLIIWIHKNGKKIVLKYKFSLYTWMTILIRPLVTAPKDGIEPLVRPGYPFQKTLLMLKIQDFVKRWVVNPYDRLFFVKMAIHTFETLTALPKDTLPLTYLNYLNVCESIRTKVLDNTSILDSIDPKSWIPESVTILLINGPVGYGKSTLRSMLEKNGWFTIGYDEQEETLNKGLKNNKTEGGLAAALSKGCAVAIENGGGAFFNGDTLTIQEKLAQYINSDVWLEFILFTPTEFFTDMTKDQMLAKFLTRTSEVTTQRFNADRFPDIKKEEDAQKIFEGVTTRNLDIQLDTFKYFIDNHMMVIGYNAVKGDFKFTEPIPKIKNIPLEVTNVTYGATAEFMFNKKKTIGHVTFGYDVPVQIGFESLEKFTPSTHEGRILTFIESTNSKKKASGLILDLSGDSHAVKISGRINPHVTISVAPFEASQSGELIGLYNSGKRKVRLSELKDVSSDQDKEFVLSIITLPNSQDVEKIKVSLTSPYCYCL